MPAKPGKSRYESVTLEPSRGDNAGPDTLAKIKAVAKMISKGKSRLTCLEYIQENYNVGENQAKKYYWAALDYLRLENDDQEAERLRTKLITLLENQIEELNSKESVEARKAAQSAADLIAKLTALYTDKKEVKVQGDVTFEFGTPDNTDEV